MRRRTIIAALGGGGVESESADLARRGCMVAITSPAARPAKWVHFRAMKLNWRA
jgi:hypothetical protein